MNGVQKQWYQQTEQEVCDFFDVDPNIGLSHQSSLRRLKHFGPNKDLFIPKALAGALKVSVIRSSKQQDIVLGQLMPGDVVSLKAGDRVPADLRLIKVQSCVINQSYITGDALPVTKNTFRIKGSVDIGKQKCMAFAGTIVEHGTAFGIVVARGPETLQNKIGINKKHHKRKAGGTLLARRLKRLGIIVVNKAAIVNLRKINLIIIDYPCTEADMTQIIHKVQITRRINCKFIINDNKIANNMASKWRTHAYDAGNPTCDIEQAQIITGLNMGLTLKLVSSLNDSGHKILWLSNGTVQQHIDGLVAINFVIGDQARDDLILATDLYGPKTSPSGVSQILYNSR